MPDTEDEPHRPAEFAAALDAIRHATPRAELVVTEISAPGNLAPYAVALSADVSPVRHGSDSDFGTGRFILLYDPDEPDSWGGPFRVVCFAQAPLETDIGVDPFLAEVAWAWLVDALDSRGALYTAASGTATKILSSGFGELARQGDGAQIELRASWSPLNNDLAAHVEGWGELLCMLAGLPPAGELPVASRRAHSAHPAHAETGPRRHDAQNAPQQDQDLHSPDQYSPDRYSPDQRPDQYSPDQHSPDQHGPEDHEHRPPTDGIALGPLDPIGPSGSRVRRNGPGLHTLGVVAAGLDSGGMETVGVDITGPETIGAESAGRETVGMNAVGMNTVGMDTVGVASVGMHPVRTDAVGSAPSISAVADLSAHRAARA